MAADKHADEYAAPDADQDGDADQDQDANSNPLEFTHADQDADDYADQDADQAANQDADDHADQDQNADADADSAGVDANAHPDPVLWQRLLDRMAKGGLHHDLVSSAVPGRLPIAPGTACPATGIHAGLSPEIGVGYAMAARSQIRVFDPVPMSRALRSTLDRSAEKITPARFMRHRRLGS